MTTLANMVPSTVTERYALVRPIAEGATSMVYLSLHGPTQRLCAVKVMASDPDGRWLHRYTREAAAARAIDDVHVLKVLDAGHVGATSYLVSEYAEGRSAVDWVARHGPMPARMAVELVRDACLAVQSAHERRIVHGNLGPAKLMIDGKGRCKVAGFGGLEPGAEPPMLSASALYGDMRGLAAALYTLLTGYPPPIPPWGDVQEAKDIPPILLATMERAHGATELPAYASSMELYRELGDLMWSLPASPMATPSILTEQPVVDLFTPTLSDRGHRPRPVPPPPAAQTPKSSLDLSREDLTEGGRLRMLEAQQAPGPSFRLDLRVVALPVAAAVVVSVLLSLTLMSMAHSRMKALSAQRADLQDEAYEVIIDQVKPSILHGLTRITDERHTYAGANQIVELLEVVTQLGDSKEDALLLPTAKRLQLVLEHQLMEDVLSRARSTQSTDLEFSYWDLHDANVVLERALADLEH